MACNNQDACMASNVAPLVRGRCKKSAYNSLTISRERTRFGRYDQGFRKRTRDAVAAVRPKK